MNLTELKWPLQVLLSTENLLNFPLGHATLSHQSMKSLDYLIRSMLPSHGINILNCNRVNKYGYSSSFTHM